MKKWKLILVGTLLVLSICVLAGCGNENNEQTGSNTDTGNNTNESTNVIEEVITDAATGIKDAVTEAATLAGDAVTGAENNETTHLDDGTDTENTESTGVVEDMINR
jgi:ABC-type oligopeptide transport system substrate-binding subunit